MPKKGGMNNQKLRFKIEKLISKYERKNKKEEKMLKVSKNAQKKLEELLTKVPKESNQVDEKLNKEMFQIHKEFKKDMKNIKMECKKERKEWKRERKNLKKEKKLSKKEERNNRKEKKEEKLKELELARIEELPNFIESSENKENSKVYKLIIDGWNITGCDKIARMSMRGKRNEGAKRMIYLVSKFGLNKSNNKKYKLEIHFDGNGKSETQIFNSSNEESNELNNVSIDVKYSGKEEIVDDRLVRELSKISNPLENANIIVVTSDRELTLRLNKIGVKVMKSGCFYKKYLKEFAFEGLENENENKKFNGKEKKEKREKKEKKEKKHKKGKKHWKKYIKNKFSDNSNSSSTSSDSSITLDECDSDFGVIVTKD